MPRVTTHPLTHPPTTPHGGIEPGWWASGVAKGGAPPTTPRGRTGPSHARMGWRPRCHSAVVSFQRKEIHFVATPFTSTINLTNKAGAAGPGTHPQRQIDGLWL